MMLLSIAGVTVASVAHADDRAAIEHRLAALEQEVAHLRAAQRGDAWVSESRAADIRGIIADVIADTDTRSGFLSQQGVTAGWDGHPFIAGPDGNFRLDIETRLQLRYVMNIQDDAPGVDDTTRGGFEARRVRSILSGHIIDPSITYKIQATYHRSGGAFLLEDAFIQKDFENGVYLRAGQFRAPFTREANVSTFRTTAVERAIAHGAIELGRSQGVEVGWENEMISIRGSFNDGDGLANTPAMMADTEYAFSARGEVLLAGSWRQFRDFTGWRGDDFGLLIGGGVHYQRGEFGAMLPARADDFRWTVDASAEFSGAHLFGAVGGRHVDSDSGSELDVFIAVLQGGAFLTDDVEAFARIEWGDDDDSPDDLWLLTIGGTKYWAKHNLKWTIDIGYAFDAVSATFASSGAGWREDPPGTDGQIVVRTQLQMAF